MAHGIIASVPAPIEMYEAVHTQVTEKVGHGGAAAGLLVHVARKTPEGFQVIEVWESKQQCDAFENEVLAPIIDRVSGGQAPPRRDVTEEFEVLKFFFGPGVSTASS
jgi:hypothetical protein